MNKSHVVTNFSLTIIISPSIEFQIGQQIFSVIFFFMRIQKFNFCCKLFWEQVGVRMIEMKETDYTTRKLLFAYSLKCRKKTHRRHIKPFGTVQPYIKTENKALTKKSLQTSLRSTCMCVRKKNHHVILYFYRHHQDSTLIFSQVCLERRYFEYLHEICLNFLHSCCPTEFIKRTFKRELCTLCSYTLSYV